MMLPLSWAPPATFSLIALLLLYFFGLFLSTYWLPVSSRGFGYRWQQANHTLSCKWEKGALSPSPERFRSALHPALARGLECPIGGRSQPWAVPQNQMSGGGAEWSPLGRICSAKTGQTEAAAGQTLPLLSSTCARLLSGSPHLRTCVLDLGDFFGEGV